VRTIPVIHRNAVTRYNRQARERNGGRGAFDAEIRSLGLEPHSEVEVSRVPASADVARVLGIHEGVPVVARRRRMAADGVTVQLATSFIPTDIADGTRLVDQDSGPGGIVSRFAELGYAQTRITEAVRSRRPTEAEATALGLDPDQFVTEIFHVGWTAEGRAVEVCVHVVAASQWVLDYEFTIDG